MSLYASHNFNKSTTSLISFDNDSIDSANHKSRSVNSSVDESQFKTTKNKNEWIQSLTPAYEKTLMKVKCGFCKMFFHRNSVGYKVPNHRLYDLQKSWGVKKEGRRYTNAAFLYRMAEVCTFCSQFFALLPEEHKPVHDDACKLEGPIKLNIQTEVKRSNIAESQRAYQSSEIDRKGAMNAVTPPFSMESRTRREADPWWEVDFGRQFHVHTLSFHVSTGIRQKLVVSVFLLKKGYGFEDPFLATIANKAVIKKEFRLDPRDKSEYEHLKWELPANTICSAIRIQLTGVLTLGLRRFEVLQGDSMVHSTLEDTAEEAALSFATLSPQRLKKSLEEAISPEKRKKLIAAHDRERASADVRENVRSTTVPLLRGQIESQYQTIENWKARVIECASIFGEQEIVSIYKVIFKYASDLNFNDMDQTIHEYDLLGGALTYHYPRCQLGELSKRIRAVLSLIQQRSQLKQLLGLHLSENFLRVANDATYYVKQLNDVFDKLNQYWDKKGKKEQLQRSRSKSLGFAGTTAEESRGCSWSQFLIIMRCFCTLQFTSIPKLAFNVDFTRAVSAGSIALPPAQQQSLQDDDFFITGGGYESPVGAGGELDAHSMASLPSLATMGAAGGVAGSAALPGAGAGAGLGATATTSNSMADTMDGGNAEGADASAFGGGGGISTSNDPPQINTNFNAALGPASMMNLSASMPAFGGTTYGQNGTISGRNSPSRSERRARTAQIRQAGQDRAMEYLAAPIYNRSLIPSRSQQDSHEQQLLLDTVRAEARFPPYNSSFAEYKFASFKRRVAMEPTFPKTLSLEFARSLIPKRSSTSHGGSSMTDGMLMNAGGRGNDHESQQGSRAQDDDNRSHDTRYEAEYSGLVGDNTIFAPGAHDKYAPAAGSTPGTPLLSRGASHARSLRKMPTLGRLALDPNASANGINSPANLTPKGGGGGGGGGFMSPKPGGLTPFGKPGSAASAGLLRVGTATGSSSNALLSTTPNTAGAGGRQRLKAMGRLVTNLSRTAPASSTVESASRAFDDFSIGGGLDEDFDDFDDEGSSGTKKNGGDNTPVDFFKVCALCEKRFPRDAMGNKILRKHLVKLRSSWDPALVSKDIRKLDNTISMYNLVNVCMFCAQFFDPDFDDGIAYPVRIESPAPKVKGVLSAISSQSKDVQLIPYYDTRFPRSMHPDALVVTEAGEYAEGGAVFLRPQTVDARERAKRACNIAREYAARQASIQEAMEQSRLQEERIRPSSQGHNSSRSSTHFSNSSSSTKVGRSSK